MFQSISLTWQHAIGQDLPSYITNSAAFYPFHTSLMQFGTFLITDWLNLIIHLLLCPITHRVDAPIFMVTYTLLVTCLVYYGNPHTLTNHAPPLFMVTSALHALTNHAPQLFMH
jgi:hypothetical protein